MKSFNNKGHRVMRAAQRGFTLMEVMVALGISLLILTALALLFRSNSSTHQELEKVTRLTENARYAMESISHDVRHAGFLGEINPRDLSPIYSDLSACATNAADMGWDLTPLATDDPPLMPTPIRGFAGGTLSCLENRNAVLTAEANPALSIVRANISNVIAAGSRVAGAIYLHPSRCNQDVAGVELLDSTTTPTLRSRDCAATFGLVRELMQRTYYLASCSHCAGTADQIPSLRRADFVNGSYQSTTLAEGIERLGFEYGIDTDSNGVADAFVPASEVDGDPATHVWQNVIAVRISLLARAESDSPNHVDGNTYTIGGQAYAPGDNRKRVFLSQTVRLMNVAGRLEQ